MTVLFTWDLWQERLSPPNLPLWIPIQIWFLPFVLGSLIWVGLDPKRGLCLHFGVLVLAGLDDQMRLQPQFFAIWMLMAACVLDRGPELVRWFLISLWLWAGVHKLLSPEWFGVNSWILVDALGLEPGWFHQWFAWLVLSSEIGLGIAAAVNPRWAAWFVAPLHFGIVLFLVAIQWNFSVIPWNLVTAVVGTWVLFRVSARTPASLPELVLAGVFLIAPALFYVGWVDHGFANVLYSGNVPRARVTTSTGSYEIAGWGALRVPFPNEQRTFRKFFEVVGMPGDKLHISDPRFGFGNAFFAMSATGRIEPIVEADFFASNQEGIRGWAVDPRTITFRLGRSGCKLFRSSTTGCVIKVVLAQDELSDELVSDLCGLNNIHRLEFENVQSNHEQWQQQLFQGIPKLTSIKIGGQVVSRSDWARASQNH